MAGAPINFPSNPTTNQSYTFGTKTWVFNGYGWKLQTPVPSNTEISSFSTVADGATSTFDLGYTPIANDAIFVSIGGVVQNEGDYVVNPANNTISFVEPPPISENVRVVGYKTVTPYYLDVANSIGAAVSTFNGVGDGSTQNFNLGFNPYGANSVFVTVGGIVQPDNAYTVSNVTNTITFGTAPQNNENIRVVGFSKVNPFATYYVNSNVSVSVYETTANGNTTTFPLGFNPQAREVLTVTIDGIVQPISVYTVNTTANTITFDSAPANSELVRVSTFYTAANAFVTPDGTISLVKVDPQVYNLIFNSSNVANSTANTINSSVQIVQDAANLAIANVVSASSNVLSNTSVLNTANAALLIANAASLTANAASLTANNASNTANLAATTGKAIAMSIVFGG